MKPLSKNLVHLNTGEYRLDIVDTEVGACCRHCNGCDRFTDRQTDRHSDTHTTHTHRHNRLLRPSRMQ